MARTLATLTNLSGSVSTGTFTTTSYQTVFQDLTNPHFPRTVQLTDQGLKVTSSGTTVGVLTSDLLSLGVQHYPALTWKPVVSKVIENLIPNNAVFSVRNDYSVHGLVPGQTYAWVKGSNEATMATNGLQAVNNAGPQGTVVTFTASYEAMIFSGPASQSITLRLYPTASFGVVTGPNPIDFSVTATSEVPVNYQWDVSTDSGATYVAVSGTNYSLPGPGNDMAILNTGSLSGYVYKCEVVNAAGTTVTTPFTLTVN